MEEHFVSINDHLDFYPNYRYAWLEVASRSAWDGSTPIYHSAIVNMELDHKRAQPVTEIKVSLRWTSTS